MAFLNGIADLPTNAFSSFPRPEHGTACNRSNVLYHLADYIRSATLSGVVHDTAGTAWGLLAPVWLQRQQRVKLLEKMMNEVNNASVISLEPPLM
jgi:hypothetical protein